MRSLHSLRHQAVARFRLSPFDRDGAGSDSALPRLESIAVRTS
jgi:hypothetical protein